MWYKPMALLYEEVILGRIIIRSTRPRTLAFCGFLDRAVLHSTLHSTPSSTNQDAASNDHVRSAAHNPRRSCQADNTAAYNERFTTRRPRHMLYCTVPYCTVIAARTYAHATAKKRAKQTSEGGTG